MRVRIVVVSLPRGDRKQGKFRVDVFMELDPRYAAPMGHLCLAGVRFDYEADMLRPLARHAERFLPAAEVLFEVPCSAGVPDLVLLNIDDEAMTTRRGTVPLQEPVDIRVMLALDTAPSRFLGIQDLATATRVSGSHLRRRVIPRMVEGGHVEAMDSGWRSVYGWRSLARRIVTLEAKRRDWRRGLAQATRHSAVADEAWLVLDAGAYRSAELHRDWFLTYDVGLASLSVSGTLTMSVVPKVNRSRQLQRELLVERSLGLYLQGLSSGPLPRVFGSVLVASTGDDPRLVDGGVRSGPLEG